MLHEVSLRDKRVWSLIKELAEFNLIIHAVADGVASGRTLVDNVERPEAVAVGTPDGIFLGGRPGEAFTAELRREVPYLVDLRAGTPEWERRAPEAAKNTAVTRKKRRYYKHTGSAPSRDNSLPEGYRLARFDEECLNNCGGSTGELEGWIEDSWGSKEQFFWKGFGFCVTYDGAVVSRCLSDSVKGERCEIGVWTDPAHRRKGLARATAARTVEHCLSSGLTSIGWHCLDTNVGSVKVAEAVGFRLDREYYAFSSELPAANPTDFTREALMKWAEFYQGKPDADGLCRYRAAECWALAAENEKVVSLLEMLRREGWLTPNLAPLLDSWPFKGIRQSSGFKNLREALTST